MLFELAKNSFFLQNLVVNVLTGIHPSIDHNLDKTKVLKKAFWNAELEDVEGMYLEFGVFEGTSLYSSLKITQNIKSKFNRLHYGFDSFDEGFKYFDERDKHPFFKEGDFKSSYKRVSKRLRKFKNAHLVKGYFEETVQGKKLEEVCNDNKVAVLFIDCDLMHPALIALNFAAPGLQQGAIIILDDYWAYKGDPDLGTSGALKAFLKQHPNIEVREFFPYGVGGMSFIVSKV